MSNKTQKSVVTARFSPKLVLSFVVSAVFLYLAFRNVSLDELGSALGNVRISWLVLAVGISFLMMVLRAWRWQIELRPLETIKLGKLWVVTSVAYMAINLLPVRLGEVVRPWLLSKRSTVSISNVVGNLVVEKMMDSLCIVFYLLTGLLMVETLPTWVRQGAIVPASIAVLLVTAVLLFWWKGNVFVDSFMSPIIPDRYAAKVKNLLAAAVDGMQILPNPRLLLSVLILSLALWFLPILSSYVMIQAFNLSAPFSAALVIFIFISFGTALPNLPGMIGPYQYACQLALGIYGVSEVEALAYGLVLNAVQFFTIILQGLIALPIAGVRFAEIRRASNQEITELRK